jgi:hypothetical protein
LQLLAIKRLQAGGASLAEVQERLVGLTEAALARLAKLPPDMELASATAEESPPRAPFWAAEPAAPPASFTPHAEPTPDIVGIPLDDGVLLLVQSSRIPDEYDRRALRAAAAPVLKVLQARRIVSRAPEPGPNQGEDS